MRNFRLTAEEMNNLAERYPTPFLVASVAKLQENYAFLQAQLPRVKLYYAMKANPAARFLTALARLGAGFDVAAAGEMQQLAGLGISGRKMLYANPVKTPQGLQKAAELGVTRCTLDDASEIPKLAAYLPGAEVLGRIRVENKQALVDLNAKFGAAPEDALDLLRAAKAAGLRPLGLAFHVGSQSLSGEAYSEALHLCRRLFDRSAQQGLPLTVLDIGGGFPIPAPHLPQPDTAAILSLVRQQLDELFPATELWAEPGRFLCGTAVNLVTSVIGTKTRQGQTWYVLDEGIYGTFSGALFDHWAFDFIAFKATPPQPTTLLGPSCDSIDFVRRNVLLPELAIGDRLLVPDCGAYTSASATTFNGFAKAPMLFYEDVCD